LHSNVLDNNQMLSRKDQMYWNYANAQSEMLSANMTDETKQLLTDFEQHFPKSKFEDENA